MNKLYWILATILLGACSQNEFLESTDKKDQQQECTFVLFDNGVDSPMLRFNNTNSFFKVFDELLNKNYEEQNTWAKSLNKEALLANLEFCEDSIIESTPVAFQALFNKQLKVQINDSLFQYNNGAMYLTAINNKILEEPLICGSAVSSAVKVPNEPQTRQQGEVSFDRLGMNHQYEFSYSRTHKYVHEFRSFSTSVNGRQSQILIMNYKLEFDRRGWQQARDTRDIIIDLQCTARLIDLFYPVDYVHSPSGTFKNVQYIMEIPIAKITYQNGVNGNNPNGNVWSVTCKGKITHTIVGAPYTKWEDIWY